MSAKVIAAAPEVNKALLVLTGATEIRSSFPPEQQPVIISGYMWGVKVVFAMCIATTGAATLIAAFTRWKKLNQAALTGGAV